MNIEECIEQLKDLRLHCLSIGYEFDKDAEAIEYILTAYEEKCKELKKEIQDDLDVRNRWGLTLQELEKEKEKNKKAKEFIKENSHEFYCKRDELIELEFDDNTNATDLIDILDGNW